MSLLDTFSCLRKRMRRGGIDDSERENENVKPKRNADKHMRALISVR